MEMGAQNQEMPAPPPEHPSLLRHPSAAPKGNSYHEPHHVAQPGCILMASPGKVVSGGKPIVK